MSLLRYTGPPKLRRWTADDSADWLVLPLPTFNRHLDAQTTDLTYWKERADYSLDIGPQGVLNRTAFVFGYAAGHLANSSGTLGGVAVSGLDLVDALVAELLFRKVDFVPRTKAASDPDLGAEEAFVCRVTSDIPRSAHLVLGTDFPLELVSVEALL